MMDQTVGRISELIQFVDEYRWIYDVQVTKLFVKQWWNHIPQEVRS